MTSTRSGTSARVLAALAVALLAPAPPAAAEPLDGVPVVTGRLDGAPVAWLGCVRPAGDTTGARTDCVVAAVLPGAPDAAAVRATVVSYRPGGPVVERVTLPRTSLRASFASGLWSVRFTATLASLGEVDVTHQAHPSLALVRATDTCALLPLHVELATSPAALSPVVHTTGTVGHTSVSNLDACASTLAVGPVSGTWRAAGGL